MSRHYMAVGLRRQLESLLWGLFGEKAEEVGKRGDLLSRLSVRGKRVRFRQETKAV